MRTQGYRPNYPEVVVPHCWAARKVRACLVDLDGVLTDTATPHARREGMFDLPSRASRAHRRKIRSLRPCRGLSHVCGHGKKREDGVRSTAPSKCPTVWMLSRRGSCMAWATAKNDMLRKLLRTFRWGPGVRSRYLEAVTAAGLGVAVVSSSRQHPRLLATTGLDRFVQQQIGRRDVRESTSPASRPRPSCARQNCWGVTPSGGVRTPCRGGGRPRRQPCAVVW